MRQRDDITRCQSCPVRPRSRRSLPAHRQRVTPACSAPTRGPARRNQGPSMPTSGSSHTLDHSTTTAFQKRFTTHQKKRFSPRTSSNPNSCFSPTHQDTPERSRDRAGTLLLHPYQMLEKPLPKKTTTSVPTPLPRVHNIKIHNTKKDEKSNWKTTRKE